MDSNFNICGSCRNCCKGVKIKISDVDIKRWKNNHMYKILLCLEQWPGGSVYLIQKKDRDECIFLGDMGCEIYSVRPDICRRFPQGSNQVKKFGCLLDWKTHKRRTNRQNR